MENNLIQLERRNKSKNCLKEKGIVCCENLKLVESSSNVKLKNFDTIYKKVAATWLIILLINDLKKGNYEAKETVKMALALFGLSDNLNSKERKLFDDTYQDQAIIDLDCENEIFWTLLWALGFVDDISDGGKMYDHEFAKNIMLPKTVSDLENESNLRNIEEILDMVDLYYCYAWAIDNNKINSETSIGNLNPSVVTERRKALEWLISSETDWYNINLSI